MLWEEKIFYERREAKEEEHLRMISLKLKKGKTAEQIAEELELSVEDIETYMGVIEQS